MSQLFQHTEGIILRSLPFRDYDQILILFTSDAGLIKLLYKGSRSKKRGLQGVCMPLTRVEVVYKERRGEIFSCQEMALLDPYRSLRQHLVHLETACDLLQVVYTTQWVGKPAPLLYALLKCYLDKIPLVCHPTLLASSFRLKLLKHEGLLSLPLHCSHCQNPLIKGAFSHQGELFCLLHQLSGSLFLQEKELEVFYQLTACQSYQELIQIALSPKVSAKIDCFFKEKMQKG